MGKYTGSKCIICQNTFGDDDDIVVCPDCGTPYHRSCYQSEGHCVNTSLHAVGGSWQSQQNEIRMKLGGRPCPSCGFVNKPDARDCASCGTSLMQEYDEQPSPSAVRIPLPGGHNVYFDAADPCCGASPEEPVEEERLGDVASFVGRNTLYYIPLFRRFRDTGRKISLNLTCILFPYLYFAYRKMWPMAILSALINIACGLPYSMLNMLTTLQSKEYTDMLTQLYGEESAHMFDGLTAFLSSQEGLLNTLGVPLFLFSLGIRLVFCLSANYMYYRHVLGGVGKIRKAAPTQSVRTALLHSEGGASILNVIGCAVLYYFLNVGIYVVMAVIFMR